MKRFMSLFLCVAVIVSMALGTALPASAADYEKSNGFIFRLDSAKKEYSVRIGSLSGAVKFPGSYKGLPVTKIENGSGSASAVTSIYIPDSIVSIEEEAFRGFTALESVSGAKNLKIIGMRAFYDCKNLTGVDLGSKVSSIGKEAFTGAPVKSEYDCPGLKFVDDYLVGSNSAQVSNPIVVPEGIITIADYALANVFEDSLTPQGPNTVILPESLRCIGAYAFFETWGMTDVQLPSKLLSIGEYAFYYNPTLKNVNIPANVKKIGTGAFKECGNITVTVDSANKYFKIVDNVLFRKDGKVIYDHIGKMTSVSYTVPEGVVKIADKAFYESELAAVTISSTVKTIGESAFENNKKLKTVVIGKSVSSVGNGAFMDCTKLSSLTVKKGCTTIGDRMFAGCTALKSVALPAGVKSIGHFAFYDCTNLSKLSLPSTVAHIGSNAFSGTYYVENGKYTNGILYCGTNVICTNSSQLGSTVTVKKGTTCIAGYTFSCYYNKEVKKIVLPESLLYIGMYSFGPIENLTSVTIPAGVKSIGEGAFSDCKNLKTVTVKGGTTAIGDYSLGYNRGGKVQGFKICALKGSKAHSYAVENGYGFSSIGVYLSTPKLASSKNVSNGINIKWNAVKYAEGYRVYRKAPGETSWTRLGDVKGLSYTDKNVKNGKQYTYTVRAFNGKTFSGYSKTGISQTFLSTPKLTKIQNGASGIKITWGKVSGADGYIVYRKTSGSWERIAKIKDAKTLSYYDKTAKAGKTYTYTVKAYDGSLTSGYNTTGISIKRLLTPELTGISSAKAGVTVKWGKVTGASGYYVYRKTGSGSWERIAKVTDGTKVAYLDKTAKKGVTYSYTVKAFSGKSASSHNSSGLTIKDKY